MSEIGLNINVDSYNNEGIKTIKGNNNAEIYKLYILKNKRRLSLVGKTVKLGYVMVGTTNGDVIENLNITNAEQGEITFPITNRISKQDGVYSCQLAIYGADGFLEHTATFGLTVEANIFTKIAGEIADSKDFTYLENILDKASKLSEKLKENTSSATNANSNLEYNITEANNINSKLLENTSTATSLNSNLESNINLAKEVKETIKDLDTKNTEATEKIETLTGLNSKATELSNNIQQGLPLNSELIKNTESAKVTNTNLAATNQEATTKNTELQASLEKTKEFINGLDGSQNIPQIRMDVTELQNGLKSNQALAYTGSSISADNTLEGRTEGMKIEGRTLVNLAAKKDFFISVDNSKATYSWSNMKNLYKAGIYTIKNITGKILVWNIHKIDNDNWVKAITVNSSSTITLEENQYIRNIQALSSNGFIIDDSIEKILSENVIILDNNQVDVIDSIKYFEGIKSFGEAEGNKISILSHGKNLGNIDKMIEIYSRVDSKNLKKQNNGFCIAGALFHGYSKDVFELKYKPNTQYRFKYHYKRTTADYSHFFQIVYTDGTTTQYYAPPDILEFDVNLLSTNGKTIDYIKTSYSASNGWSEFSNIILTEGTKDYIFEPYQSNKKDILIKESLREGDIIYEDNGQVKVCRKSYEYTLNGENEDWIVWTNSTGDTVNAYVYFNRMTPNLSGIVKPNSSNTNDRLPANQGGYLSTKEGFKITSEYFAISIHKSKLGVTNVNDPNNSTLIKKWLKANPITMICQLATPVTEVVDGLIDIDLDTYQEKTYFSIENSLPGTLDFKVPSNLGSSLQNLAKEVNNIWDVINNLLVPSLIETNKNIAMATIKNNLK